MSTQPSNPFVSVITPAYNAEKYLSRCIDSILTQEYEHWEYTIVDNCSTDKTAEIAESYRQKDDRIKVIRNDNFVGVIENHNIAFRNISSDSKYCKLVSADDWLYPECIERLVQLAERSPSVGIVQSYILNNVGVRWTGLPVHADVFDGRQVGRLYLLGRMDCAGVPSSSLYRSSFVRSSTAFFPGSSLAADAAACLDCLQHSDFGVVHQILSFERIHDEALTAKVRELSSYLLDRIELVMRYGPIYLARDEMTVRLEELYRYYYGVLAAAIVNVRGIEFWEYHRQRLSELGLPFYGVRLAKAFVLKLLDLSLNPKQTVEKAGRVLKTKVNLTVGKSEL